MNPVNLEKIDKIDVYTLLFVYVGNHTFNLNVKKLRHIFRRLPKKES